MFSRRLVLAVVAALALSSAPAALASETRVFDAAAFAAAQKAGRPILIDVTAPWCPTCKAQKPILEGFATRPELKNLIVFEVDFDSRKDVLAALNVRQQSTLIAYKGTKEVGRSVGDTNVESVTAMVGKSI